MTTVLTIAALFIPILIILFALAYLLEGKMTRDSQRELDKYGIKIELDHNLGQPWEVDNE